MEPREKRENGIVAENGAEAQEEGALQSFGWRQK